MLSADVRMNHTVYNVGIRSTGPNLPSLCTMTMLQQETQSQSPQQGILLLENDNDIDAILLEYDVYKAGMGSQLQRLIQRLQHRFPNTIIIFVRIRMLQDYYHVPSHTNVWDWLQQQQPKASTSLEKEESGANTLDIRNIIKKTHSSDWTTYPLTQMKQAQDAILRKTKVVLLEFPSPTFSDPRRDIIEYAPLYGPHDWVHLSPKGNEVLALELHHKLQQQLQLKTKNRKRKHASFNTKTKQSQSQQQQDRCDNWMGSVAQGVQRWTAGNVTLPHSPNMILQPFYEDERWKETRFAMNVVVVPTSSLHEVSGNNNNDGGDAYIIVENEFGTEAELHINHMAMGPATAQIYPKTLVTVEAMNNQQQPSSQKQQKQQHLLQVLIDPLAPVLQHLQVTTYIGKLPASPSQYKVRFQPQEEGKAAPFRVTGIVVMSSLP